MAQRILVVEDEPAIAESVAYALRRDGFTVAHHRQLRTGRTRRGGSRSSIVLDLMLPDGSGFDLIGKLRKARRYTPIIVLSSRDGEADRVAALETGADDYVTKPFSPREVVARVRAVLRRSALGGGEREARAVADSACGRRRHAPRSGQRPAARADARRVRSAGHAARRARPRLHARAAHRSRLGRRLRDHRPHHRLPRQVAAQEARRGGRRPRRHRDRARRRLPGQRRAERRTSEHVTRLVDRRGRRDRPDPVRRVRGVAPVAHAHARHVDSHAGVPGARRDRRRLRVRPRADGDRPDRGARRQPRHAGGGGRGAAIAGMLAGEMDRAGWAFDEVAARLEQREAPRRRPAAGALRSRRVGDLSRRSEERARHSGHRVRRRTARQCAASARARCAWSSPRS